MTFYVILLVIQHSLSDDNPLSKSEEERILKAGGEIYENEGIKR